MARSDKTAMVLAGMIIAAVYVIMLIGLTRSTYFIGGAALMRTARTADFEVSTRSAGPLPASPPACPAPPVRVEELQTCAQATQLLQRLLNR